MAIEIERRHSPSAGRVVEIPVVRTKYMYFEKEIDYTGRTERWTVCNNQSHEPLGLIQWYGAWRQYVFEPDDGSIIFNNSCLRIIEDFLTDLNIKQRDKFRQRVITPLQPTLS